MFFIYRALKWEKAASDFLLKTIPEDSKFSLLKVYVSTIQGISDEATDNIIKTTPYLFVAQMIVGTYCIFSMMMKDWVVSKPWLGLAAIFANCSGCLAGIGLMQLLGVDFITINMGVPFIMLGMCVCTKRFFFLLEVVERNLFMFVFRFVKYSGRN